MIIVNGKAIITPVDAEGTSQSYKISVEEDALVKFRTLYFPGWQAQVNGQVVSVSSNDEGHMQVAGKVADVCRPSNTVEP
jgi:hypothetical protein